MEVFIVKRLYTGNSFGGDYEDIGFVDYDDAVMYCATRNGEMNELRNKYSENIYAISEAVSKLFAEYLKENDKEKYDKYFSGDLSGVNGKFWDDYHADRDEFLFENNIETIMNQLNMDDSTKAMVRLYTEYHSFGDEGLPYYHVSSTPINVIQKGEEVKQ